MGEPINCPFCGGAAICDPVEHGYHRVFCRSVITCGAAGSARPTREEAIGMWSRRAGQHVAATESALSWRCFHCDYVTANKDEARAHFGDTLTGDPTSCLLAKLDAKERIIDQLLAKENGRA